MVGNQIKTGHWFPPLSGLAWPQTLPTCQALLLYKIELYHIFVVQSASVPCFNPPFWRIYECFLLIKTNICRFNISLRNPRVRFTELSNTAKWRSLPDATASHGQLGDGSAHPTTAIHVKTHRGAEWWVICKPWGIFKRQNALKEDLNDSTMALCTWDWANQKLRIQG